MPSEAQILPAIRRLYDAATDAEKWPAFLQELARAFEAGGANIVRVHPRDHVLTFSVLYGYDDVVLRLYGDGGADFGTAFARYQRHFGELMPTDPRVRFLEQYPNRPLSCRLAISDAELHGSKSYQELLKHADVEYSLVVSLPEEDGSLIMFGVFRGKAGTFFTEQEVETFGELIPHVKQAVAMSERLARIDFANRVALEALDSVSMGILIVDESARVIHANATAMRIIDMADGVSLQNGAVTLTSKEANAGLRRAIWGAVAKARSGRISQGEAMAAGRRSGGQPFPTMVGALWGNYLRYGLGRLDRPLAVVFITIPEEPQEAPAELLRRLFGLTLAEARLCERLVLGRTVEQAAGELDIATNTARVHLKRAFDKTGVSRQAELVAKILATPVWLHHRERDCRAGLGR
jgi:DNA-binding CsgD family transcriptional regulator